MERPVEPSDEDCCGSGCDNCVFDVYRRKLHLYQQNLSGLPQQPTSQAAPNLISDTVYTPFQIVYHKQICEKHSVIAFRHHGDARGRRISWSPGQHFVMRFTSSETVTSKAYTPLNITDLIEDDVKYDFIIIVKKYEEGLVSTYLHSRLVGNEILWRGPYGCFQHKANKFKRMCMIAQGTGIAPFYSIINTVLQNEDDYTKILLLTCYKNLDTILLRKELYLFRQYWNFNYKIFISSISVGNSTIKYKEPIALRKLNISDVKESMWPLSNSDCFLICGSSQFMNHYFDCLIEEGCELDNIMRF